ncbi:MAG: hypothetical protein PHV18_01845 [Lachnospiraceae bacterium]|nr:hypothetical protein [Lachnospiraceae bacterium]
MNKRMTCIRHHGIMNEGIPLRYENAPVITKEDYENRIEKLLSAASQYSHLLIYADKEHFSNLEYITGYDPRYEECMMLLKKGALPRLIVGNEGMGQSQCITIAHDKVLFQSLSPMGQGRGKSQKLTEILEDYGMEASAHVGVLGWKAFSEDESDDPKHMFEVPAYIVKALRHNGCDLENANGLMMDNDCGLRIVSDTKTLILSEIASTKASRKTWNFVSGLKEGMTEIEASQMFAIDGEPCPTYPNICFYGKGILSPDYHRILKLGEPIAFGMGYRYAQIHRVGLYVRDFGDLDMKYRDHMETLFATYFEAVAVWFESLGIGVTGGEVWSRVKEVIGSYETFGIALNPGHFIHTEEWLNSPFVENGTAVLKSGMLIQCDFTARPASCMGLGVHLEDGLILADQVQQEEIRRLAPDSYERMKNRQKFMREVLGINLRDEVLPTSDICGMMHPFFADLDYLVVRAQGE